MATTSLSNKYFPAGTSIVRTFLVLLLCAPAIRAQSAPATNARIDALEQRVQQLQAELNDLRSAIATEKSLSPSPLSAEGKASTATAPVPAPNSPAIATTVATDAKPRMPLLPASSTINLTFDGYYSYNFNSPPGRVNYLHPYDVLSNSFNLNQAAAIFELPTDVEHGRRFGMRLDLQFGQATETLQGNPASENRPEIYRNVFQAYGRYVAPIGHGLTLDFGKWSSSLGYEGNYTKDQLNYSRSFFFNFLPFYHAGLRANYQVNSKLALNYWTVNGPEQSEPVNSFHDQMGGFALTPTKNVSWTVNYYLGQEHPDAAPATNCTIPVQPGLCFTPIVNPANGKLHIFDSYATWQARPSLLFVLEGDYVIQRQWQNAAPGESSAPSHVLGYAAYAQYQFNSHAAFTGRSEYLSDRGGLFSNTTQSLKEATGTFRYNFGDGFMTMLEYRRDWSNRAFFPTGPIGSPSKHQDIFTVGLVWWYGGKQGAW